VGKDRGLESNDWLGTSTQTREGGVGWGKGSKTYEIYEARYFTIKLECGG